MLNRKPVNLTKRWITKPLHKDSFTQVLIGRNSGTMHRLYMITNELEPRQEFLELKDHDKITITAVVTITPGYAQEAREQANVLSWMQAQIKQRPTFTVKLYIYDKANMMETFSFKHTTTSEKEVYRLMDMLEQKVINTI